MPIAARESRIPLNPLPAWLILTALLAVPAPGLPAPGNPPVSVLAEFPPTLRERVGPDSNACGITPPAGWSLAAAAGKKASGGKATGGKNKAFGKRPLIIWLHGGMRSRNMEKGFEAHRALISFVSPSAYWLASPSSYLDNEWTRPQGVVHIDALIAYLAARYPVDTSDITMVGVSDGCLGVIAYAVHGKRAISRRILVSSAPQLVLDAEALPGQKRFAAGRWDFLQGGRDRLFPPDKVVPYLRRWESLYPNAHLHYFPDGEHDFSYYAVNASDLLRTLLLPDTRNQARKN
jgi:pimeloyl-ACP methyl ester carboxylesterase